MCGLWKRVEILSASPKCGTDERRIQGEHDKLWDVDESRKRVIGVMAAILAARKLAQYDGGKRVPATVAAIADAIRWAEEIMWEIDGRWPDGKAERRGA